MPPVPVLLALGVLLGFASWWTPVRGTTALQLLAIEGIAFALAITGG
jgi:hypothetical protein